DLASLAGIRRLLHDLLEHGTRFGRIAQSDRGDVASNRLAVGVLAATQPADDRQRNRAIVLLMCVNEVLRLLVGGWWRWRDGGARGDIWTGHRLLLATGAA